MIDPRGPRFTAAVTLVLLAVALLVPTPVAVAIVATQVVFFALGALRGIQYTPTALVFRTLVRPRLAPPVDLEDARPPRFAQAVGLGFMVLALVGFATGALVLAQVAIAMAFAAALLNAAFGLCLGCELYLVSLRVHSRAN